MWCRGRRRRRFRRGFRRFLHGHFGLRLWFGSTLQPMTNFLCDFNGNRTGVRLLFCYAKFGQQVNNRFRFDLEFTSQFVDSNLG